MLYEEAYGLQVRFSYYLVRNLYHIREFISLIGNRLIPHSGILTLGSGLNGDKPNILNPR